MKGIVRCLGRSRGPDDGFREYESQCEIQQRRLSPRPRTPRSATMPAQRVGMGPVRRYVSEDASVQLWATRPGGAAVSPPQGTRSDGGQNGPAGPDWERQPVSRVLAAGAKGAERVAHATGIDRALNQAAEEAIVRALRSPAVIRAIKRATEEQELLGSLNSDEFAQVVKRTLESDAAGHAWREFLKSEHAQMLVERIVCSPEVRSAITSQGASLIKDVGIRLTVVTERLDKAMERVTHRRDPDVQIDRAGLATQAVAGAIDLGLLIAAYALVFNLRAALVAAIFKRPLSIAAAIISVALLVVIGGVVFAGFWVLTGQTPGMRFLAIRLRRADGSSEIGFGLGVRRVIAVIVSIIPLGLGYIVILWDPRRRSWADRMTGTEVIYDAAARMAPHAAAGVTVRAAAQLNRVDTNSRPNGSQLAVDGHQTVPNE